MSLAPLGRSKTIHWTIISKIDTRWNGHGESGGFITVLPHNINKHIEKCEKRYGKRPKDLTYEAHKE